MANLMHHIIKLVGVLEKLKAKNTEKAKSSYYLIVIT